MAVETFRSVIARNKRNSILLMGCFMIFFIALGMLIGVVWGGYVDDATGQYNPNWAFSISVAAGAGVLAFILCMASLYGGSSMLMAASGAHEIQKSDDPQLYNVVEELCLAGGLPLPKIYLINTPALNAFATGRDPKHASVAITTGLRGKLKREELQGVMAHELSHVRHFDIRYAMLAAVMVGCVVMLCDIFMRSLWFGAGSRGRSRDNNNGGNQAQVILMVIAVVLAILAPIFAMILQMALSRQREYLADAGAVELTRNPSGLADALKTLSADMTPMEQANRATAPLCIVQPVMQARSEKQKAGLFDTHPPTAERIKRLEALEQ